MNNADAIAIDVTSRIARPGIAGMPNHGASQQRSQVLPMAPVPAFTKSDHVMTWQ
jgi:hypothetical protein